LTGSLRIGNDEFVFSPSALSYKGQTIRPDDVVALRWGVFKQYLNGIRVDRRFTVFISDRNRTIEIECARFLKKEEDVLELFFEVIDKVWKTAGVRLLVQMIRAIMAGADIEYGSAKVNKNGIWFQKQGWFSSTPFFSQWEDLRKVTADGCLKLSSDADSQATAQLSLREVPNAVVLDRLLEILWKDGNHEKLRTGTLLS
jgi:hypothetical protein